MTLKVTLDHKLGVVAQLLSCLVALATLTCVGIVSVPSLRTRFARAPSSGYSVGDKMDLPTSYYDGSRYTLIVFAKPDCGGCQSSTVLFRAARDAAFALNIGVLLAMPESGKVALDSEFVRSIGFEGRTRFVAHRSIRLKTVPTIVLVDKGGTILSVQARSLRPGDDVRALVGALIAPATSQRVPS